MLTSQITGISVFGYLFSFDFIILLESSRTENQLCLSTFFLQINFMTLQRFCKRLEKGEMPTVGYKSTGLVFIKDQQKLLADYVVNAANMFHGLSPRIIKQLAFEYAKPNCINYPHSWDTNACAGPDWFRGFMKKHDDL